MTDEILPVQFREVRSKCLPQPTKACPAHAVHTQIVPTQLEFRVEKCFTNCSQELHSGQLVTSWPLLQAILFGRSQLNG